MITSERKDVIYNKISIITIKGWNYFSIALKIN